MTRATPNRLAPDLATARGKTRGRGAISNPANRFDGRACEADGDWLDQAGDTEPSPETVTIADASKSILVRNESPDVGFGVGLNPFRGCEHGCVYCYARPTHEYLGFSAGLDFETRILVKEDAPALLREALAHPRWSPETVVMSGNTDCYQPLEHRLRLTRGCLAVFAEFRNPVAIITKNRLVTRDIDLLADLAGVNATAVFISVTTLDAGLSRRLEPRASLPRQRLEALHALSAAGIPTGVMVAPVIPGLTDHEIPAILGEAAAAGATRAGKVVLRLPHAVGTVFEEWLEHHYPARKDKVMRRVRSLRGGRCNDPRFGTRMRGEGPYAAQIEGLFNAACKRFGLSKGDAPLSIAAFRRPHGPGGQLALF